MRNLKVLCLWLLAGSAGWVLTTAAAAGARGIPRPMGDHPGNVFLADEEIILTAPAPDASAAKAPGSTSWRVIDYDGMVVTEPQTGSNELRLGKLAPGYYEAW